MVVLKFGGTSVGEIDAIRRVVEIIAAERRPRAVVVSALAGVTDALLRLAAAGGTNPGGSAPCALASLHERHVATARMVRNDLARIALERGLEAVTARVAATLESVPGRLTLGARDDVAAAGELWSSRILAAVLRDRGLDAIWIDPRDVLRTDSAHGEAVPDLDATRAAVTRVVRPQLARGSVVVLGGFVGADAYGATTTLGRGGSDYSAAVIGACLDAAEIQIWTDVDGVLTADPRVIPHARLVPRLTYGEAYDLATFGAKVLHPGTIRPAVDRGIPVLVRSSHRPGAAGTVIDGGHEGDSGARRGGNPSVASGFGGRSTKLTAALSVSKGRTGLNAHDSRLGSGSDTLTSRPRVTGLACHSGVTLVEVVAPESPASEAFLTAVFDAMSAGRVEAVLVDCRGDRLAFTVRDLADAGVLRASLEAVAGVRLTSGLAMVCAVGEVLAADSGAAGDGAAADGVAADAVAALHDLEVHLVARPPHRRTLAFVIDERHTTAALARLHDCFFGLAPRRAPALRSVVRA